MPYFRKLSSTCTHELARRRENEHASALRSADEPIDDRERERGGLAGSGLRETDHVAPAQRERNRFALDRRWVGVPRVANRVEHLRAQAEICEGD